MNEETSQNELSELFEALPDSIKNVIRNSNWEQSIESIGKKNNLLLDTMAALENLVLLIMLGVINPKDIKQELLVIGIEKEKIDAIVYDIESQIFSKIKSDLVKHFEKENIDKQGIINNSPEEPDRETILKEIEDPEETQLAIPVEPNPPAIQTNQTVQQTAPTQNQPQNTVAQKLQTPSVSEPKVVKIDPYREPF